MNETNNGNENLPNNNPTGNTNPNRPNNRFRPRYQGPNRPNPNNGNIVNPNVTPQSTPRPNNNPNRNRNNGNRGRTFNSQGIEVRQPNNNPNRPRGLNNGPRNINRNRGRQFGNNPQNNNISRNSQGQNNIYFTANAIGWAENASYQFSATDTETRLKIIPVSGVEMVGVNCTAFEYGDDIVVIDAGLGFPGDSLTGVDALVPNVNFLTEKKQNVRGLVITHGHTDHIGGLHHVIDKLGFPMVYAPRLAAGLIREKLKEYGLQDRVKITEIDGDSSYYLGKFQISHFKMTHTIPDNFGVVLNTPVGRIVCTSDYKFDSSPYKESPSDYSKLAKLGDEGVLLMLDESTNARKPGWSDSETDIAKDIEDIIREAKGRVLIGMFSTMVNRVRQVIEIADRYHKKVAVLGRSLENIAKITHELGYIDVANSVFVPFDQVNDIPDDQLVILTTGSQGEANAALMRMATDTHAKVSLKQSDTIVFSSSRIPGNEGKIDNLINLITLKGCKVLTNDYLTLHSTGHGHKEDHKLMLRLVKPKFFMPVHGEPTMLKAHKETAVEMGYAEQNIIMPSNGVVIELSKEGWKITDKIDTTPLWVEGNRIGDFDPVLIEERKLLADEGVVIVTLTNVTEAGFGLSNLDIVHKGFFVQVSDEFFHKSLPQSIVDTIINLTIKDKESIKSSIKRYVENELKKRYEKQPLIVVSVL